MNITVENGIAEMPCVFTKAAFKDAIAEAGYFETGNIHESCRWRKGELSRLWCRVDRIVLFDDPDSVSLVDAKVWRNNSTGTAFLEQGKYAETHARESAMTHKRCNTCSTLYRKNGYCHQCSKDKETRDFMRLKPIKYTGKPCVIGETWIFEEFQLKEYLLTHDIMPSEAMVEGASPHNLPEIDLEHWHDDLPEDYDESTLHPDIISALNSLNSAIREHGKAVSYFRDGTRIVLDDDFIGDYS